MRYHWYCVGAFPEEGRISPFRVDRMSEISFDEEYKGDDYADFQVEEYIRHFKYDEEDTFKDDRPRLATDAYMYKFRKKYGVSPAAPRTPYPW